VGNSRPRLEASFVLTPVVRQGPAPDGIRNGGNQPAHQSMSTDVQRARFQPCTAPYLFFTNATPAGDRILHPLSLKADIRAWSEGRLAAWVIDDADAGWSTCVGFFA
jgi:hypothetical protein